MCITICQKMHLSLILFDDTFCHCLASQNRLKGILRSCTHFFYNFIKNSNANYCFLSEKFMGIKKIFKITILSRKLKFLTNNRKQLTQMICCGFFFVGYQSFRKKYILICKSSKEFSIKNQEF